MNSGLDYGQFYKVLLALREAFHSSGRFDDSNAKLDEIVKLLCIAYDRALKNESFTVLDLKSLALSEFGDESKSASALRNMFSQVVCGDLFVNDDGTSIFGANPALSIQETEDAFAEELVFELSKIDFLSLLKESDSNNFDVINECFGHFVRENFRNNKEDAQYMTPMEIAHPYIDTVYREMIRDGYFDDIEQLDFKVMDPTCGVGTLLLEAAKRYVALVDKSESPEKANIKSKFLASGIIGQDKVDRMVRLSKINSILYGANASNIFCGNSIVGTSNIDRYVESIDLIFTNPPFGADFVKEELSTGLISAIDSDCLTGKKFPSEILMLYRSLEMLKDGGYLAIVLPDSVVSSKGNNAKIRKGLLLRRDVQSVVELPAVTFAQAGTRTKTVILLVRKCAPSNDSIVMCTCNSVGYLVKERSGVPVKIYSGDNDVEKFAEAYPSSRKGDCETIVSTEPSITAVTAKDLISEQLTPSFYSAERLETSLTLKNNENQDYEFLPLKVIASFETKGRKKLATSENVKHISVLHVRGDSTIDFGEVETFNPISEGRICKNRDVIFSKINPSIPRMAVIPEMPYQMVCSTEFEIMTPIDDRIGPNTLCTILKSASVQAQIRNLTSGTSSSHNRIKTEQLEEILVPCPKSEQANKAYCDIETSVGEAFASKYQCDATLAESLKRINEAI